MKKLTVFLILISSLAYAQGLLTTNAINTATQRVVFADGDLGDIVVHDGAGDYVKTNLVTAITAVVATNAVQSITAGTNIVITGTALNPIINSTATGGGGGIVTTDIDAESKLSAIVTNINFATDGSGSYATGAEGDLANTALQPGDNLNATNLIGIVSTNNLPAEALIGGGLENVVEDVTPQLGGSLDVNGNKIVSTASGNIDIEPDGTGNVLLGNFTIDADQTVGAGQDNYVLTYDDAGGVISLEASAGGGGGLANVVEDLTPQLGGDLDANSNKIVSVSNADIDIEPNGTGNVLLGNFTIDADQTVGAGQDNYVLTYDDAGGVISLEASAGGAGGVGSEPDNRYTITGTTNITVDVTNGAYQQFTATTNSVVSWAGSTNLWEVNVLLIDHDAWSQTWNVGNWVSGSNGVIENSKEWIIVHGSNTTAIVGAELDQDL